jgi:hypothetical protein
VLWICVLVRWTSFQPIFSLHVFRFYDRPCEITQSLRPTVALGGAPLALGGLAALAAARSTLAATAERREKIQAEIARREAQKKAVSASADAGGLAQAAGLLGAAFVSLGLIVANPLGETANDFQLPSLSLPSIGQVAPAPKAVAEPKAPSPSELAAAKIRAAQAARLEEKVQFPAHCPCTDEQSTHGTCFSRDVFSASPMKPRSRRRPLPRLLPVHREVSLLAQRPRWITTNRCFRAPLRRDRRP